jgi:hypothetical protein
MAIETKRGYITKAELESYADIAISDDNEALERMELAEEIIDNYVGFQNSFRRYDLTGQASGGTTTTLVDTNTNSVINSITEDILSYCTLEIIGGTNAGESRTIISNTTDGTVTVHKAFTSAIDSTSVYRIYQLGKFPRTQDYKLVNDIYYKFIPEKVKRACLAQVEYMINMGDDFFNSGVDKHSENIDGYSYNIKESVRRMLAPKAREYLHGIVNRKGYLVV